MRKSAITLTLAFFSSVAWSDSDYSTKQLHHMVSSGDYPQEGTMTDWKRSSLPFGQCKNAAEEVVAKYHGKYPVKVIYDDKKLYMVKAWHNTGVTKATCTSLDLSLTTANFEYFHSEEKADIP